MWRWPARPRIRAGGGAEYYLRHDGSAEWKSASIQGKRRAQSTESVREVGSAGANRIQYRVSSGGDDLFAEEFGAFDQEPEELGTYRGRRADFIASPIAETPLVAREDPYLSAPVLAALEPADAGILNWLGAAPYAARAPMDESSKALAEANNVVKVQRVQLKRFLVRRRA